ncbi:portal protein [Afipia carboxidovorans]|uniref:portal protein n=1 Tax=Afipia carboxidovorans TaxID=40137 RepID=UPI0030864A58|nr:hypothetical protein CRBSH125_05950 [Afipia carboxidovorans]
MAKPSDPAATSPKEALQSEALDRLADCRQQKRLSQIDIEECYFFAAPRRLRSASSQSTETNRRKDESELQTSIGYEVADDFMTMLIESFMPQSARWAERLAEPGTPAGIKTIVEEKAKAEDEKVFGMIRASNFYAELGKQGVPDAAIGVIALDIRNKNTHSAVQCLSVPIRELEINIGPDGRIDDRFQVRKTKFRHLRGILGKDISLPKEIEKKIATPEDAKKPCEVRWGYWKLWDRDDDQYWQHVVMIDDVVIHDELLKGAGSCGLVIGRFGSTPDFAWPDGPMIKALPELRQHDEQRAGFVENVDFTLRPPFTYDDDGVISFEDGIEPGMAYPRRPGGGRETIQPIYEHQPLDAALFEEQKTEKRIRRLHYVDFPEQLGKTPPTLGQWLDEMVKAQKRIGTPGYTFWSEFPFEVFQRFKYLGEKRGAVKPIEVDGKQLNLTAYNPAQRAQDNQEVLTATRVMQIAGSAFPQVFQAAVDPLETIGNIQRKLGDKLVVLHSKEDLQQAVKDLSQLGGVKGPNAPGGLVGSTQDAG